MSKIIHYRNKCIGCNSCVEIVPDFWKMSRVDGKSVLIGGVEKNGVFRIKIERFSVKKNKEAASACPVKIIHVIE